MSELNSVLVAWAYSELFGRPITGRVHPTPYTRNTRTSTQNPHHSTLNHQPEILDPQPQTRDTRPSTLNSNHSITGVSNPEPRFLDPQPCTLHPEPSALNLPPSIPTLHPKRRILVQIHQHSSLGQSTQCLSLGLTRCFLAAQLQIA